MLGVIPALGRWISEFEASLVYRVSSKTARGTQRNPVSENNKKQQQKKPQNAFGGTPEERAGCHRAVISPFRTQEN